MKRFSALAALFVAFILSGTICWPYSASAADVTVMAVGDILPHASWQPFQIPTFDLFEGVVATFYEADLVIGNLESPLTDGVKPTSAKSSESLKAKRNFVFKAEGEDTAAGLKDAGFTVLTLANNHILDYSEEGLLDTLDRLSAQGIKTAGAGRNKAEAERPCVVGTSGMEVVVVAASDVVPEGFEAAADKPGVASMKRDNAFIERVRKARAQYPDALLVLSLHWGAEATYMPTQRQKELARRFVDAGADLILGHHPHRMQGVEIYKDRPVFYSLGNFQFDTNEPGDETFIATIVYAEGSHVPANISVKPVKIRDGGYPVLLEQGTKPYSAILERLGKLSGAFGMTLDGERLVPTPPAEDEGYDYWGT